MCDLTLVGAQFKCVAKGTSRPHRNRWKAFGEAPPDGGLPEPQESVKLQNGILRSFTECLPLGLGLLPLCHRPVEPQHRHAIYLGFDDSFEVCVREGVYHHNVWSAQLHILILSSRIRDKDPDFRHVHLGISRPDPNGVHWNSFFSDFLDSS